MTWKFVLAGIVISGVSACGGSVHGGEGEHASRRVNLRGGQGTAGAGGQGGNALVYAAGGDVAVRTSGTMPAPPAWSKRAPPLGTNPRTVSGSITLTGNSIKGDDDTTAATGLHVLPGATLTLVPATASTEVSLTFAKGILVEGTIALALIGTGPSRAGLTVVCDALVVAASGRIDASGQDREITPGGDGGSLSFEIAVEAYNLGTIVTRGGRGSTGGTGGVIDIIVRGPAISSDVVPASVVNTGTLDSSGGAGLTGLGGNAGETSLWGRSSGDGACHAFNAGRMIARGGSGSTGGGNGQGVFLSSCRSGWAVHTGVMDASGGDATVAGNGGGAGWMGLGASGNAVYATGTFRSRGGRGAVGGQGGDGGFIELYSTEIDPVIRLAQSALSNQVPGVFVAAEVDAAGGDGEIGGAGGLLEANVWQRSSGWDADAGVHLLGCGAFDAAGGEGTTVGGAGGNVAVFAEKHWNGASYERVGSAVNEVAIDVRGGRASAGSGGPGGFASIYTQLESVPDLTRSVISSGAIMAQGGEGRIHGGAGGTVLVRDHFRAESLAPIDASGGAAGSGAGGAAGSVTLESDGSLAVLGSVRACGGSSASGTVGGAGGTVDANGGAASASLATVTCDGGAAPNGVGGAGGAVTLTSDDSSSRAREIVSVRGGTGAISGTVGTFSIDAVQQSLVDGQYRP